MRYVSLLRYKPKDASPLGRKCDGLVKAIKNDWAISDGSPASEVVARVFKKLVDQDEDLQAVFDGTAALMPAPRHAPRNKEALWPALRIAKAMLDHKLGNEVLIGVERHEKIRESHTAGGDRPSVEEHLETLRSCLPMNAKPKRVILVDDVITKGVTAWACREIVLDEIPGAEVVTFAAVSTEHRDATLVGPVAIRDGEIVEGNWGPWRPDTRDPETWAE